MFAHVNTVVSSGSMPSCDLQTVKELGNGIYSIVASFSTDELTTDMVDQAISNVTDHKVRVVEGSARLVSTQGNLVAALVQANSTTKDFSEASKMKVMAANIFEDDFSNLWRVVGDQDNKRLVMSSDENLTALLAAKLSRNIVNTRVKVSTFASALTGDFCKFYNVKSGKMDNGFAIVDSENKLSMVTEAGVVEANPESVIAAVVGESIVSDHQYAETAATEANLKQIVDYLSSLFKNTEMFAEYVKVINKQISKKGE